ncbi:MAG: mechanosensitive ion channel family protein [Crocinitomicaceae bacterium]|jgi:small-conductance mechanosensitive channel|nr:mechanosensitive ion channel family protein [Crocinitomicaceae bacterium]
MNLEIYKLQIFETALVLIFLILVKVIARNSINRILSKFDFGVERKRISHKIVNLFISLFGLIFLAGIWNIDRSQLMVFITSTITLVGVGFIAQWSILSNVTSSLILFFNHPMKLGQEISILDKEYDIHGTLIDISFFFMYIKTQEGEIITIPNSVVLSKVIKVKGKV